MAEHEREMISARTKAALAATKARGMKLGGNRGKLHLVAGKGCRVSAMARLSKAKRRATDIVPVVESIRASGATSFRRIAAALNAQGIRASKGGEWNATQVMRILRQAATY